MSKPLRGNEFIANFDSASAMVRALGRHLKGRDTPLIGQFPRPLDRILERPAEAIGNAITALPVPLKEQVYSWAGWGEAVQQHKLRKLQAEDLSAWAVSQYPKRRYPGVVIGGSNGAAIHLAAAMGYPFLPQTLLTPVRRHGPHPDEPKEDLDQMVHAGRELLDANPDLQLHHMHDANQDRLMIKHMAYFRVKRLRLGETYTRFLEERLQPGAPILVTDCTLRWPGHQVGERHFFQHGAPGGATPDEYLHGSERVRDYLARYGSHRRGWDYPETDGGFPEAEWGFERTLRTDIERFARRNGNPVLTLRYEQPEDVSPVVADLHREWYRQRGFPAKRLLVDSFLLMDPHMTLLTGSVPYWGLFNTEPTERKLTAYLDRSEPYDEIHMTVFSHGVESIGLVPVERWRALLDHRARKRGEMLGVDEEAYPRHFSVMMRYHDEMRQKVHARYAMPGPLDLPRVDALMRRLATPESGVEWIGPSSLADAATMAERAAT